MWQGKDNSNEPPTMMEKLGHSRPLRGKVIPPESMFLNSKCDGDVGGLCCTPSINTGTEELPNSQKKEKPVEHQPHIPLRRGGKVIRCDRMSSGSPDATPTSDAEDELPHPKTEQPQLRRGGKIFAWQYQLMKSSSDNDDDDDDDDDDGDGKDDADDDGDDDGDDDDGGGDDDEDEDDDDGDDGDDNGDVDGNDDEIPSSSDADSSNDSEEDDKPRGGKRIKLHAFKRKALPAEPLLYQADPSAPACVPEETLTSIAQMPEETERVLQEEDV